MSQFIVTIGAPGAGKSTWAEKNLSPECLRVERDLFRQALFGSKGAYFAHPMPRTALSFTIGSAMAAAIRAWHSDLPVAMTDTGIYWDSVKRFWDCRPNKKLVVFKTPMSVLHERNAARGPDDQVEVLDLERYFAHQWSSDAWWRKAIAEGVEVEYV